jgi:DNA repair protein RadC
VGAYHISSGGITGTVVDIKIVLAIALKALACAIVIAHTHPSGSLKPSRADEELILKLREAAKLMDILLLDHLILSTEGYYSFADEGVM